MKKSIEQILCREKLQVLGLSLLLSVGLRTSFAEARSIPSDSMEPTLQLRDPEGSRVAARAIADKPTLPPQLAKTFHPGFWQPIARINPALPIKLVVVNESNLPLQYGLTTGATYSASPKSEDVLNSISAPASVLIYSPAAHSNLRYNVSSNNNTVWVMVRDIGRNLPRNESLNIDRSGAIYVD